MIYIHKAVKVAIQNVVERFTAPTKRVEGDILYVAIGPTYQGQPIGLLLALTYA
jgi:hypothetical protein